jgi:hypothetical protein
MKRTLLLAWMACLLAGTAGRCWGNEEYEDVSPQRATALGITVQAKAEGPDGVRVYIALEPKGALREYARVDLERSAGGKLLLSATLRGASPAHDGGVVRISFFAASKELDNLTVVIVTGRPMDMVLHNLHLRDFKLG